MVNGGEPDTLHSISPAFPTTVLQSFNFLENVGGMILSVREGNKDLVVHHDKYKCKCTVINRSGYETFFGTNQKVLPVSKPLKY